MKLRLPKRALTVLAATAIGAIAITGTAFAVSPQPAHRPHGIAAEWAAAWNGTDPQALAKLFAPDSTYTDLAANKVSVGRAGVAAWKQGTDQLIAGVHVTITETFRSGDHVAIETLYSGHIHGAPNPFAVPTTTILELKDGQITSDRDYYSLTTLLAQSGLPLTWTPPAP